MSTPEERREANDRLIAHNINKYGCHVISVFDPEERAPAFSYSVGIVEKTGLPEVLYEDFLEGFSIYVEPAKAALVKEYMLGCDRYYKDKSYDAVQLVYPSTSGVWPWEPGATEWFKLNQPMLGRKVPSRP